MVVSTRANGECPKQNFLNKRCIDRLGLLRKDITTRRQGFLLGKEEGKVKRILEGRKYLLLVPYTFTTQFY